MKTSISKEVWCLWNKLLQKRESLLRAKATTADEKFTAWNIHQALIQC